MKKVLILGAAGMAGHMIYYYLQEKRKYNIYTLVFKNKINNFNYECDVRDANKLNQILKSLKPEIVINCIGSLINDSKNNPDNAILINSWLPHYLAKIGNQINYKLIHISSDCVFSGRTGYYAETDFKDADDIYGRTKSLGEINNQKDITLRTSIIGPELNINGKGLLNWFMNQKGEIEGYSKMIWGGVTTLELAKVIELFINNNKYGLFHITNGNIISKLDLLMLLKKYFKNNVNYIIPNDNIIINKSLQKSLAINITIPSYEIMIKELIEWMHYHKILYQIYNL